MGQLNNKRADRALLALDAFCPDDGDIYTQIKDLVCDLGHLAVRKGITRIEYTGLIKAANNLFVGEVMDDE